jgi:uncharacterized protein YggE
MLGEAMSSGIKNILGMALVLSLAVLSYAGLSYVKSYSRAVRPPSQGLSVTGEGRVFAPPDVAAFTVGVITEGGKDIPGLQRENTERTKRIIGFLKSKEVNPDDIRTTAYRVEPRYSRPDCPKGAATPCPPPEIVGYSINQTVSVKVRDFDMIGVLLEGAVSLGANTVSRLSFAIEDPWTLQGLAREEAVKKAQEAALAMARAGGFRLGRLLSVQETSVPPVLYETRTFAAMEAAPQVEPGVEEITSEVTLTYEIIE